jgi:bacillithiol system protein YtxJ
MSLITLDTITAVDALFDTSTAELVVIFKHSYACPISYRAYLEVKHVFEQQAHLNARWFLVDVIANRAISQQIAKQSGVRHESPQILILKNGKVVNYYSHNSIRKEKVTADLDSFS